MSKRHCYLLIGRPPGAPGVPGNGRPRGLKAAAGLAKASCDSTLLAEDVTAGGTPAFNNAPGKPPAPAAAGGKRPGNPGNSNGFGEAGSPRSNKAEAAAKVTAAAGELLLLPGNDVGISRGFWGNLGRGLPLTFLGGLWEPSLSSGSGLNLGGDTGGGDEESLRPLLRMGI